MIQLLSLLFGLVALPLFAETFHEEEDRFNQALMDRGLLRQAYQFSQDRLARGGLSGPEQDLARLRLGNICLALASQLSMTASKETYFKETEAIFSDLLPRAETIAQKPEAAIELIRLLATRGGLALNRWKTSGNPGDRKDAESLCRLASSSLAPLLSTLESQVEKIEQNLSDAELEANEEYKKLEAWIGEAQYRKAWTSYYFALCTAGKEEKASLLGEAEEFFDAFTSKYKNSLLIINCFLGRAQCYDERGDTEKALKLLEPIQSGTAPDALLLQANLLRAGWLFKLKRYKEVVDLVDGAVPQARPEGQFASSELALLLKQAEASFKVWRAEKDDSYRERGNKIAERVSAQGDPWSTQALALLSRYRPGSSSGRPKGGLEAWIDAESLYGEKKYVEALALYTLVVENPEELKDKSTLPACRFRRAACLYLLHNFEEAAVSFEEFLSRHPEHSLAEKAAYLAAQSRCGLFRRSQNPEDGQSCVAAMEQFIARWPESPDLTSARLASAEGLSLTGRHREALETLGKIAPGSDQADGVLAITLLCRRREVEARFRGGDAKAAESARALANEMQAFIDQRGGKGDWPAQLKISLAELALEQILDDPKRAAHVLARFDQLHPEASTDLRTSTLRLRLSAYVRLEQWESAEAELARLLEQPPGQPASAAALLEAAKGMQDAGLKAFQSGQYEKGQHYSLKSAQAYEALLHGMKIRGNTPQPMDEIRLRLVKVYLFCQEVSRARQHLETLAQSSPKAWEVLRGFALCEELEKRHSSALEKWREIEEGLEAGKAEWYEAKYHIALCLVLLDEKEKARKILEVTRLLHPDLGGGEWKKKLEQLEQKLQVRP